ncbi:MAG: hypothetical protein DBX55_10525 [Verrucomicrobia bacterium]|nr:MAG: hypothetical protein DBX55_10525 [Verrucomicrobiota bacterium]
MGLKIYPVFLACQDVSPRSMGMRRLTNCASALKTRSVKKFVFLSGIFAARSAALAATQIFIFPKGSDTGGNGTRHSPRGSIARAKAAFKSASCGESFFRNGDGPVGGVYFRRL